MTFKEFETWCNERACDGCWSMLTAIVCIDIIGKMRKVPFWKRKKVWKTQYENRVLEEIVNPIENKIKEIYG